MSWWMLAAGAAAGLGKSLSEQQSAEKKKKLAAVTTMYSPWTRMSAKVPEDPNHLSNVLQGALTGLAMSQNSEKIKDGKHNNDKIMSGSKDNLNYWGKLS